MIVFQVNDMSCGHCVSAITQAVKQVDPDAEVEVDLNRHLVQIAPGTSGIAELSSAIAEAGYTPVVR